jgi:hypothetical protein
MLEVSGYKGPAHPLSFPIAPLTAVNTAEFNHRAVGIRNCESAFHLTSTILGGRDIIEEFVAARIWPISSGWSPNEIVYFNVNWADQEVPFPKFGIKLRENQSADAFMIEIEKRVNVMIGEYTMKEYKAYKALVKHKKRMNRVFTEVCGDKSFSSRGPGPKLKVPAVAVTSCSAAPINAPRMRSSKRGSSSVSESTSSGVKPSRTRSLESSKRKRKTSEQTSDAELQAASGLAEMSRKKLKKAVKKISSSGIRRVPSAFDDDVFVGADSQKGFCFWPLFNFETIVRQVLRMSSWILIPFQMLLPKLAKRLHLLLLLRPLLLLKLLPLSRPPLLPKPLLPMFLCPLAPGTKLPPNSPRSLNSPFKGGRILPNMLPWSKFERLFPKIRLPLLLWPLSTRVLVRLIAASY